jgi:hypothetical protein
MVTTHVTDADDAVETPVRIVEDGRGTARYQVVEADAQLRRVLAWGFGSESAARGWVDAHNRANLWHRLALHDH